MNNLGKCQLLKQSNMTNMLHELTSVKIYCRLIQMIDSFGVWGSKIKMDLVKD